MLWDSRQRLKQGSNSLFYKTARGKNKEVMRDDVEWAGGGMPVQWQKKSPLCSNFPMTFIIMKTKRGGRIGSKALLILFIQKCRMRGWGGEFINLHN
jgi:hypothetical protein